MGLAADLPAASTSLFPEVSVTLQVGRFWCLLRSRSTPLGRNGQRPSFRDQQPRFASRQRQPLTDIAAFEAHTIDGSRELARQDHWLHVD
jgi:hypothetical protein